MHSVRVCFAIAVSGMFVATACVAQKAPEWKYFRVGNAADAAGHPRPGYALMGGGEDLDEAFQWLCERAGGGDLLVLRATGTDAYNPYIQKLCPKLNSVATLVIPSREAAQDAEVARKIADASALFISGGDQANYINFWMGTPVQSALNDAIVRGIPLGGTSAGLAVMGEFAYTAQGDKPEDPDLTSKLAMANPFGPRVTIVHGFLRIPILEKIITDTHFAKRDRMGRLLVFLSQIHPGCKGFAANDIQIRGIGVEERAALLVETDGRSLAVGHGNVYFIDARDANGPQCGKAQMTFGPYRVQKVAPGRWFNIDAWTGDGVKYRLSIKDGTVRSTQAGGAVY
jgi:cyanophycinase